VPLSCQRLGRCAQNSNLNGLLIITSRNKRRLIPVNFAITELQTVQYLHFLLFQSAVIGDKIYCYLVLINSIIVIVLMG